MRISTILKALGEYRDGMLVAVTMVYVLGYLNWVLYAWRHDLGVVAAFDVQYFAAGLPIALLLGGTVALITWLHRIAGNQWRNYVNSLNARRLRGLRRVLGGVAGLFVLGPLLLTSLDVIPFSELVVWSGFVIGYIITYFYGAMKEKPDWFARFAPPLLLIYVALYASSIYVNSMYEKVPDSFGGGRPRVVRLDIKIDALSAETSAQLLDSRSPISKAGVRRTKELLMITSPTDQYLVFVPTSRVRGMTRGSRLRITREAVAAVIWESD